MLNINLFKIVTEWWDLIKSDVSCFEVNGNLRDRHSKWLGCTCSCEPSPPGCEFSLHLVCAPNFRKHCNSLLLSGLGSSQIVFNSYFNACPQAYHGHHHALEVLVQSLLDLDVRTAQGHTPLDLAAFKGHVECVDVLINQGASILVKDYTLKRTPIHAAGKVYKD